MKIKQVLSAAIALALSATIVSSAYAEEYYEQTPQIPIESLGAAENIIQRNPVVLSSSDEPQIPIAEISIDSADDLRAFRDAVNGTDINSRIARVATVNLNCDIDLGGEEWVPIGKSADVNSLTANAFDGTFNGNGHTISNFVITDAHTPSVGLFSAITAMRKTNSEYENDISVSNLKLDNIHINIESTSETNCAAVLCGIPLLPAVFENISVTNSSVTVNKTADANTNNAMLSGSLLLAYGSADANDIYVQGSINLTATASVYAGGIMGIDDDKVTTGAHTYKNCTSKTDITASSKGYLMLGGIAGYLREDTSLIGCNYLSGCALNGSGDHSTAEDARIYLSGIAGYSHSSFEDCHTGEVDIKSVGPGTVSSSGITAMAYYDVIDCSSKANLTVEGTAETIRTFAGGVVSLVSPDSASTNPLSHAEGVVKNCRWTGKNITVNSYGPTFVGGITGRIINGYTMENCYTEFGSISVKINGDGKPAGGATQSALIYVGGAVGSCYGSNLSKLVAKGEITISTPVRSIYAGGIAGRLDNSTYYLTDGENIEAKTAPGFTTDSRSYVDLSVNGRSVYAGGIAGYLNSSAKLQPSQSSITSCASFGDVTVSAASTSITGGGIGYSIDSYMADCASFGSLIIKPTNATVYCGGFAGRLKEANIKWEQTDNPLSQTYRCIAGGKVITEEPSPKVACGAFTQDVVSNLSQKPSVEVTPLYADCRYIADAPADNTHGKVITDAADKSAYDGFDFENKWTISGGNAVPLHAIPSVYAAANTEENGEAVSLDSVTVSLPGGVKKIALITTNTFNGESTVKTYDIGEVNESEKFFKTVDIGYNIPVFCKVTAVAITDDVAANKSAAADGKLRTVLTNGLNTPSTVSVYAAQYDENKALKNLTASTYTIEAMSALEINAPLFDGADKVFIWHGLKPIERFSVQQN